MRITANTKAVQLIDSEEFLSGAYNDITIDVELSEEYKGLTSFVTFNDKKTPVIAGKVSTPCLGEGLCRIGVYAVNIDDNNVVLRYSPKPVDVLITTGTWNNRIAESDTPTASEAEKIYTLIDNAIAAGQLKGDKGDPYELTAQDKKDIVNQIPYASASDHGMIKVPNGCGIVVDKEGSAKVTYPITSVTSTTDDIEIVKHTGGSTNGQFDLTFNADRYAQKNELPVKVNNLIVQTQYGLPPLGTYSGLSIYNNRLVVKEASKTNIKGRHNRNGNDGAPIFPSEIDYAVKVAMCDGVGAEWTEAEKQGAMERIGAQPKFEVGEGLSLSDGVLSLDLPSATAETLYGGDTQ